jgi:hypothetical protein
MTDRPLPDVRVVTFLLKVMSTFIPIKRIAYISFTDAKEQNENIRFEKIAL